ncbi:MAG: hypothetical protein CMJ28_04145 [Phycisphaerae bacterium]|nr:hypothetical protein [Phycisphaerae bacterium]
MGLLGGCVSLSDDPQANQSWRMSGATPAPLADARMPGGAMRSFSPATDPVERSSFSQVDQSSAVQGTRLLPSDPPSGEVIEVRKPGLSEVSQPNVKRQSLAPIQADEALARARTILLEAARDAAPALRAHAVEAAEFDATLADRVLPLALRDGNRGVRFIAVVVVARRKAEAYMPVLERLRVDPALSVRAAAVAALGCFNRSVDRTPLAEAVFSATPEHRANAAMLMGAFGTQQDLRLLREASSVPLASGTSEAQRRIVEFGLAVAAAELGDLDALESVRAGVFAPEEQGELALLACEALGRLGDQTYAGVLEERAFRAANSETPLEIGLAAAGAVAQLRPERTPVEFVTKSASNEQPLVRQQSAAVLGMTPGKDAERQLLALLQDANQLVRASAAVSVLRRGR